MIKFLLFLPLIGFVLAEEVEVRKRVSAIDENWVCRTKTSCLDCLALTQCSWCNTTSEIKTKCYSPKLANDFCSNETISYTDYGLSFENNAKCVCQGGVVETDCQPPDAAQGAPDCSGRGECKCGRCVCDIPDPDNLIKSIVGRYCELDNFSCDGPHCNEGPYPLSVAGPEEPKEAVDVPEVHDVSDFNSKEEALP